ncbi:MAG: peroxiredoxin-like family protein [Planctomycetota bacterium]
MKTFPVWALALAGLGCETAGVTSTQEGHVMNTASTSLQDKLDERRTAFNAQASDEMKAAFEQGVIEVGQDPAIANAKRVGDTAPNFTLPGPTGEQVELKNLLNNGPVVLTWYRGGWCPYCNIQLKAYQDRLDEFQALGAQLVALSPETPDNSLDTKQKNELEFHVLSDLGNRVAGSYGVAYILPTVVQQQFKGRLDVPGQNGDDTWGLPLAATYVIDTDGTIIYAYIDKDYRKRAEPEVILEALRSR